MEQLHPGAKWVFRIKGYAGAIFLLVFLSWFIIPAISVVASLILGIGTSAILFIVISSLIVFIVLVIIIAEIYARMAYNRWFYEFTSSNLKVERGIIWKKYSNIPYERVQNVDITRGIMARIFGFSSINIQTAGYSGGGRGMPVSEGYIPAVSMEAAERIRDFLMKKIGKRSQGGL